MTAVRVILIKLPTAVEITGIGRSACRKVIGLTYSVTKAGVLCLTKAVARQLAPYGVTVNAISPGAIQTAMTDVLQYDPAVKASIPLGRYGDVSDIAAAAVYLASADAGYVTGTSIDVNGGLFMK